MKIASAMQQVHFKNQQNPNEKVFVVRENKNAQPQGGKAINYDEATDTFTVENKKTEQIEKWPKKETMDLQSFIDKKEKQLTVAAQIISYQAVENDALKKENDALKGQSGQNLNLNA